MLKDKKSTETDKCKSILVGVKCDGCLGHYSLPESPHFQRVGVNILTWTDEAAIYDRYRESFKKANG